MSQARVARGFIYGIDTMLTMSNCFILIFLVICIIVLVVK